MKLADTYTNLCFIALLLSTYFQQPNVPIPLYILIVSLVSMGLYVLMKAILLVVFVVFTLTRLGILEKAVPQRQRTH